MHIFRVSAGLLLSAVLPAGGSAAEPATAPVVYSHWWVAVVATALFIAVLALVLYSNAKLRRRLRLENRRYGVAMSNAYDNVFELDLTGQTWSDVFLLNGVLSRSIMHESLDVYCERFVKEHVYKDDMASVRALLKADVLQAMSANEGSEYFEFRQRSTKGTPYWCSLLAQGLRGSREAHAAVMIYIRNIDSVKQDEIKARDRLTDALRNAERLSRVKTDFMSRISHEIRTPLNAIMGFLSIGKQSLDDREKLAHCLDKADVASHHLLSLLNSVLDISAVESGKIKPENRPFNFREFIGNAGSVYFEEARQKGIDFQINLKDVTEEYLVGDSMRLNQVLTNLVGNALKFTDRGGHVTLDISQQVVKDDSVHMTFAVKDDGIGMKEGYKERIFSAFEQEERASSRKYGGIGLGLPIVKNMVEVMGGSVEVESAPGQGSTFTVSLPLGRCQAETLTDTKRRAFSHLRVMVVDDDQASLEYAAMLLKKLGVVYEAAISGEVAVQKAAAALEKGEPYDLFLIDWRMPGMSGADTARQLQALMGDRARLVVVTGYDQSQIEAEAQGMLVARFVMKPLFQSTLVDLLGDMTGQQEVTTADQPEMPPDLSGNRCLLVEDNELNREIAMELLEQMGLTVETAEDGQQGADKFIASAPGYYQLVMMDIQMPVMDGHTAS